VAFPSSLVGMFLVVGLLAALDDESSEKLTEFYGPALTWIARWLPIFYGGLHCWLHCPCPDATGCRAVEEFLLACCCTRPVDSRVSHTPLHACSCTLNLTFASQAATS
jgi:hypothetical protein